MDDRHPGAEEIHPGDARWEELKRKSKAKANGHKPPAPLAFMDYSGPIQPRQWVVADRFPLLNVSILSGEGSIGKSILAMQLAAVVALNGMSGIDRDWLGQLPAGGPAMYITCEEDQGECERRFDDIANHYGSSRNELMKNLHVIGRVGLDSLLAELDRKTNKLQPTEFWRSFHFRALQIKPRLIVIDTVADTYGGSEIDRQQTRAFITMLRQLAIDTGAGVLLIVHPSLEGIRSGSGLSGSTAWHNSVRARAYFKAVKDDEEEDGGADPDLRELQYMKSNYSPIADALTVRWQNGVYVVEGSTNTLEQQLRMRNVDAVFLEVLRERIEQSRPVSDRSGKNYAPAVFEQHGKAKTAKPRMRGRDFVAAMERLLAAKRIVVQQIGPPSKQRWVLAEASHVVPSSND